MGGKEKERGRGQNKTGLLVFKIKMTHSSQAFLTKKLEADFGRQMKDYEIYGMIKKKKKGNASEVSFSHLFKRKP
jgi:hypothetical protein